MKKTARGHSDKVRFAALAALLCAAVFAALLCGRYTVAPARALGILFDALVRRRSAETLYALWSRAEVSAVLNVRLPRVLAAALIGAGLAVSGVSYQGVFRNPLVSPDLLGASNGAGFGAALAILLSLHYAAVTASAFVFGLAAVAVAYFIGRAAHTDAALSIVLAGMMVSSLFTSATSLVKLLADTDSQLPAITYWLMGSLSGVRGRDVHFAALPILAGLVLLFVLRWRINLLTLSEAEARSMGVDTAKLRLTVIIAATMMTAASVAVSGMIGWVGLVIPHFCRMLFGYDYRRLIPSAALMGASFLIVTDTVARTVSTAEIPLGILTGFIGAPLFLYLIASGGRRYES